MVVEGLAEAGRRESALRDWIREHKVTWETRPHYEMHGGARVLVGIDMTLLARHPNPLHTDAGCDECDAIHRTLREIALSVVPHEQRGYHVDVEPYRPALHLRPQTGWAAEVELDLEVHGLTAFAPLDAQEENSVHEIEDGLRRLGARAKTWD